MENEVIEDGDIFFVRIYDIFVTERSYPLFPNTVLNSAISQPLLEKRPLRSLITSIPIDEKPTSNLYLSSSRLLEEDLSEINRLPLVKKRQIKTISILFRRKILSMDRVGKVIRIWED